MAFTEKEIMSSPEFMENFTENYNDIVEHEEEEHKRELEADGFYEEAANEATNKAVEETKEDLTEKVIDLDPNGSPDDVCPECVEEAAHEITEPEKEGVINIIASMILSDFMEKSAAAVNVYAQGLTANAPEADDVPVSIDVPTAPRAKSDIKSSGSVLPKSASEIIDEYFNE